MSAPFTAASGSITSIADVFLSAKSQANGHKDSVNDHSSHPDIEKDNELAHLRITTMANVAKFEKMLPHQEYKDVLSFKQVYRTGTFLTLVVPVIFVLTSLLIPAYCVPLMVDGEVPTAKIFLPVGMAFVVVIPMLVFLKWMGRLMLDSFDFDDEFADDSENGGRFSCLKPSKSMVCLAIAILLRQANYLVDIAWADTPYADFYKLLLNIGTAMSFFVASVSALDSLHHSVENFAHRLDSIARNKRSQECYRTMRQLRRFHDKDKDASACIPGGHRSPAQVFADITGIYCNVAKLLAMTLLVLFFLDFDLTSNLVVLGLAVSLLATKILINSISGSRIASFKSFCVFILDDLCGYYQEIRSSERIRKCPCAVNKQCCTRRRAYIFRESWRWTT